MEVETGDGARDDARADHEIAKGFVLFAVRWLFLRSHIAGFGTLAGRSPNASSSLAVNHTSPSFEVRNPRWGCQRIYPTQIHFLQLRQRGNRDRQMRKRVSAKINVSKFLQFSDRARQRGQPVVSEVQFPQAR